MIRVIASIQNEGFVQVKWKAQKSYVILFQGADGSTIFGEPYHLVKEVVLMDSLELREHEGMVISIDFMTEG